MIKIKVVLRQHPAIVCVCHICRGDMRRFMRFMRFGRYDEDMRKHIHPVSLTRAYAFKVVL